MYSILTTVVIGLDAESRVSLSLSLSKSYVLLPDHNTITEFNKQRLKGEKKVEGWEGNLQRGGCDEGVCGI